MDDLIEVCSGKRFKVAMTPAVHKEFCKANARERARCRKWMQRYADEGEDHSLDRQKFCFEARLSMGDAKGTQVPIHAFKAWQLRVYGSLVGGVFVATEIDTQKKQNAANQAKLKAAARKLSPYHTAAGEGG